MRALALAAVILLVGISAASAASSPQAKAVLAVRQEIGRKYPLLSTVPKIVNVDHAQATISCQKLNATHYTCDWSASVKKLQEHASGSARVVVYADGAQATLYDVSCTALLGKCF